MRHIVEPNRGINVVQYLHTMMTNSPTISKWAPILADIFVFSYPVYLLGLYGYGWIKKNIQYKVSAIIIWANVVITVCTNLIIQFFLQKDRPNIVLWLLDQKHETVLHKYLPNSSFPSDHAGVSMSIAIASILRWVRHKDSKYIRFGSIGIIFSLIMCSARIMTAVHRPTDIIAGMIVGTLIPLWLLLPAPRIILNKISTRIAQKI